MARAKRLTKRKFKTESVQGLGSYVIFQKPSFADSRSFVSELRTTTKDLRTETEDPDQIDDIESDMLLMIFDKAVELFDEWNWEDENGKPLTPLPEMEDYAEELLSEEVDTIVECIRTLYGVIHDGVREGKSIS